MYIKYFRFWDELRIRSVKPSTVGQIDVVLSNLRESSLRLLKSGPHRTSSQRVLDLPADVEPFDWQHKEREDGPLPAANFVRPGKPESPVDINFDHSQAAFGKYDML